MTKPWITNLHVDGSKWARSKSKDGQKITPTFSLCVPDSANSIFSHSTNKSLHTAHSNLTTNQHTQNKH